MNSLQSFLIYNTNVSKYQLNIIFNRINVTNGKNIKCAISFGYDIDHSLWTGSNSLFQFTTSLFQEVNNIISDTSSKITLYHLPSPLTIKFECKNSKYNLPINNHEFIISNQLSPYTSSEYIDAINLGLQTSLFDSFHCKIQNTAPFFIPTFQCKINNNIPFLLSDTTISPNFKLITTNSVLNSILNFPTSITSVTTDTFFTIGQSGFTLTNNNNIFQLECIGQRNSNIQPISITIPKPTSLNNEFVFSFLETFIEAINQSFINATLANENKTNIDFTGTKIEIINYNNVSGLCTCRLTLNATIILTEKDYNMFLYDPYGYDGTISNNIWENEKNSWYSYLHFSNPFYDLNISSIIQSSQPFYSNQLFLTNENNYFSIDALENDLGGVYVKDNNIYNILIILTLTTGFYYTKEDIVNNINYLLQKNKISLGSYIDITTQTKTIFRININKIFTAQDYRIVFFDKSFTQCKFGKSTSVENVKWDTTLGWILGYRNSSEYDLSIKKLNTNTITNTSFYGEFISQAFQINIIIQISFL